MEKSRTNHVVINFLMSILNIVVGTIMPFLVRTLMIKFLGSEYMGLNNFCSSILYALNATDLGVSNAFAFKLYKPIAEKNTSEICKLLNFYKRVYLIIGIVFFMAGLCMMPFLGNFIKSDIPQGISIHIVFLLYLINTTIGYFTYSYKSILLTADQRKDFTAGLSTLSFIFIYGSQIFLIITQKYYLSVCVLPVVTLLENILINIVTRKKYPKYIAKGSITKEVRTDIKKDIFAVLIFRLRDISRNSFDNIVISSLAGLVVLSNFQNYYAIFNVPFLLLGIIYSSLAPSIGNYAVTHNKDEVFDIYKKSAFVQTVMAGWFAICYGFLIDDFVGGIWLGEQYKLPKLTAFLFAIYIYLLGENYTLKTIRESIGLLNYGKHWAILEMLTNLILNIVLMMQIGVPGVLCGTIFSMFFVSIPAENYIVYKHYFKGLFYKRLKMIILNLIWFIMTAFIVGVFCSLAPQHTLVRFVYKICVCMLVPFLTILVGFRKNEDYKYIINVIKTMIDKK